MSWKDNDALFFKELREGYEWQKLVATYFQVSGLDVQMPELTFRVSFEEAGEYIDTKDLIVNGHIIEVKSRREHFTSAKDFPYHTAFVDTVAGYDAKITKPLAYVMISRETKAMLCLPSFNKPDYWTIENRFDRVRKINENFYMAPKNKLRNLENLVQQIKNRSLNNKEDPECPKNICRSD
jgi:hypothetical protein